MSMMAETYMLQAIQAGIAQIQQTPSLLASILDALSAEEQTSAQNYFATAKIKVAPGFPQEQPDLPFVGVTVATMQQNAQLTPIGWASQTIDNGNGTSTVVSGFGVDGVIKATIYTPNADLIVWLSEVVFWCLGTQVQIFLDEGFGAIQLGLGDYEPKPDFLPIFTFARGVTLSGRWLKSFAAPPVTNVTFTTLTFNDTE